MTFFRIVADKAYWEGMQQDHGYNPPPAWTILGSFLANLRPASAPTMQLLASLDLIYLAGAFAMVWWAFGWRVFAVAECSSDARRRLTPRGRPAPPV